MDTKTMKWVPIAVMLLWPGAAMAEFSLEDLVGRWSGQGSYYEGVSKAKMKCRLTVKGNAVAVVLKGRCASSLGGARELQMTLANTASGQIVLTSEDGAARRNSNIENMSGFPDRSQLILTGSAEGESAKLQFLPQADGTLYFATEYEGADGRRWSKITLNPR